MRVIISNEDWGLVEFKKGQLYTIRYSNDGNCHTIGICTAHSVDDIIEKYSGSVVPEGVDTLLLDEISICKIPKNLKQQKEALHKKIEKLEAISNANDDKIKLIHKKLRQLDGCAS